jgi:hypothetical protein
MKSSTISKGFSEAIGERAVTRAFFSTYSFEPDFFELEVLPLLLDDPSMSTDERIRYPVLESLMSSRSSRFAVAYDVDAFPAEAAARLEVDYIPIRIGGACQHAKLAVVEVENADGSAAIVLAAGSFNLTFAGWCTNIEVGHWVELSAKNFPVNIAVPLKKALAFFLQQGNAPALSDLAATIDSWPVGRIDADCTFYFSGAGAGRESFPDFLKEVGHGRLDIVSPFFSDRGDNRRVDSFLARFDSVSLLLPKDKHGTARMTQPVHDALAERVKWCDWHADMTGFIGTENVERVLHAKIYSGAGWFFLGSVNLSYKALHENVEAGFLLTNRRRLKLLGPAATAHTFAQTDPVESAVAFDAAAMPPVRLVYSWRTGELDIWSPAAGALTLYDAEGAPYGTHRLQENVRNSVRIPRIAAQLKHSSLIAASWTKPDGSCSARCNLLVSQQQVVFRPSSLPAMDLQDLLRIFQNMHPAARTAAIAGLAARMARLNNGGMSSNEFLPPLPPEEERTSFFSEFSEVNGAFWNLRKKLREARETSNDALLAYYLDTDQPDSLRGLLRSLGASDGASGPSAIVRYLTLLSMDEIVSAYPSADSELLHEVHTMIEQTERSAEFAALPERDKFLGWIKEKFKAPVRPARAATEEQKQ